MVIAENDRPPTGETFALAIVAVGYERRCRWVVEQHAISASRGLGLEFGFLKAGSYQDNKTFFLNKSYTLLSGVDASATTAISNAVLETPADEECRIFVDISSMSREMIANVALGMQLAAKFRTIRLATAYAPSKFVGPYQAAPIRVANPIVPALAGWSSRAERPLGIIFGLGCEPGLALGALQYLEPNKAWTFAPQGNDPAYDEAMRQANEHIDDIFDVTEFNYEISKPTHTRGRLEALLNALESDFRLLVVPFGPKMFAWLSVSTAVFCDRNIGLWAFSSKDHAVVVDRDAEGPVIWHNLLLSPRRSGAQDTAS
ncbi:hypothetical protein [Bradyrhizobium sp. 170]|uniref:hypothetical protein n=1 Tax=Bradyrhizobium sp. 170 TaxID=2782641 RepID=UPI001FFE9CDA|nr:hypothetical protein [Bradyrhizobium sp. 170]UPK03018.1 hypothetical protein IVB05_36660 [Bradyrhizobium sp. 170]